CFKDFSLCTLVEKRGGSAVDGVALGKFDIALAVNRIACDVEDTAKNAFTDGDGDRISGINNGHTADEAFGGAHSDSAHHAVTEVLLHFEDEAGVLTAELI